MYEFFCILPIAEFGNGGQQGQNYADAGLPPAPLQSNAGWHNTFPNQPTVPPVQPGPPVYSIPHHVESSVHYAQGAGNLSRMAEYPSEYQVPPVSRPLQDKPTTSPHERLPSAPQHSDNRHSNANPPGHDQTSDSNMQDTGYEFFWDAGRHGHNYADADLVPATLQSNAGRHNTMPFQPPEHHLQSGPPDRMLHHVSPSVQYSGNAQGTKNPSSIAEYPAENRIPSLPRSLKDKPITCPDVSNPPVPDQTASSHMQAPARVAEISSGGFKFPDQYSIGTNPSIEDLAGNNQFPPDSTRTSSFQHGGSGKVQDSATSSSPVQVPASNCEPPFGQQEQSHQMTQEVQHPKLEELNLSGSATKPSEVSVRGPNGQESSNVALPHQADYGSQNIPPSRRQGSLAAGTSYSEQVPRPQEKIPVERHISTDFSDAGARCPKQKIPVEMSYATIKRYFQDGAKILGRGGFGVVYEGKLMEIV